jgi:hypothetical protein
MYLLLIILIIITIIVFCSQIIKKYYFKSEEDILEEHTKNFIENYKISDEEKLDLEINSLLNYDSMTRKNIRRLIAAEIKARVLENALDQKAFPSGDEWAYEKSKKELEKEKKQIEDSENNEKERIKLAEDMRVFLQGVNISQEWLVANPQLFLRELAYKAYIQTPSFARNNYQKLEDLGLSELRFCIQNKLKIINAFSAYKNRNLLS